MAIKTTQHWHAWCLLSALLLASVSLCAQQANYQKHGDVLLPDDSVTPGAVALTDTNKVCSTKWGVDERAVPKHKGNLGRECVEGAWGRFP